MFCMKIRHSLKEVSCLNEPDRKAVTISEVCITSKSHSFTVACSKYIQLLLRETKHSKCYTLLMLQSIRKWISLIFL